MKFLLASVYLAFSQMSLENWIFSLFDFKLKPAEHFTGSGWEFSSVTAAAAGGEGGGGSSGRPAWPVHCGRKTTSSDEMEQREIEAADGCAGRDKYRPLLGRLVSGHVLSQNLSYGLVGGSACSLTLPSPSKFSLNMGLHTSRPGRSQGLLYKHLCV